MALISTIQQSPDMIMVRVDCEYPLPPTTVVFEPVGLGFTAEEVLTGFTGRLRHEWYFEILTRTDDSLPFCSETVRRVIAWDTDQGSGCRCPEHPQ